MEDQGFSGLLGNLQGALISTIYTSRKLSAFSTGDEKTARVSFSCYHTGKLPAKWKHGAGSYCLSKPFLNPDTALKHTARRHEKSLTKLFLKSFLLVCSFPFLHPYFRAHFITKREGTLKRKLFVCVCVFFFLPKSGQGDSFLYKNGKEVDHKRTHEK